MARRPPESVARQLRQEAGFGCCVCGLPIIQYHHIVGWADEEHFRPDDMMVLCPTHHDQATKGAMPTAEQRRYKATPINITRGFLGGKLAVRQDYAAADFGSVTVVGEGPFLWIDGIEVLGFHIRDGNLELSLRLYNEADNLLLEIDRNEWVSGDPLPWDIQADWQRLTLRQAAGDISFSLDARPIPLQLRAKFWRGRKGVTLGKDGIHVIGETTATNFRMQELALVGMPLRVDTESIRFGPLEGEPDSMIISWPNRRERLWRAKDAWRKLKAAHAKRSPDTGNKSTT